MIVFIIRLYVYVIKWCDFSCEYQQRDIRIRRDVQITLDGVVRSKACFNSGIRPQTYTWVETSTFRKVD